jgi:hypothetical protein
MKKKIIEIVAVILIFTTGLLTGKLLDWNYFELTREFSIIEALSLVTTASIAIYITKVLEKEVLDKRTKKDLFVSEISAVEDTLRSIATLFEENDISYNKVNGRISICCERTDTLFQKITGILVYDSHPEVEKFTVLITRQLGSLFLLLIEPIPDSNDQIGLTLQGDLASYSTERVDKIRKAINAVSGSLFELKVWVNNL